DEGAGEIKFFGPGGALLASFGRLGDGPGEFRGLTFLGPRSDSLWLFDQRQLRITVHDPQQLGFRVARAGVDNAALGAVGLRQECVVRSACLSFSSAIEAMAARLQLFEAAFVLLDSTGDDEATVLVTPGSERIVRFGPATIEMLRPVMARAVS